MKTTIQKLALGVTVALVTAPVFAGTAAMAGDWNGGLKGMRGTHVPVPAPAPIPDYSPKWYLRADVGLGLGVGMDVKERGMTYGERDLPGANDPPSATGPFGLGGLLNSGHDTGYSLGFGVGHYFSPNFRMDITGEFRQEKSASLSRSFEYLTEAPPVGNPRQVNGEVTDKTEVQSAIFMANAYYDMSSLGRWKPYVGAGIGFSVNDLRRHHVTNISSCDPTPPSDCATPIEHPGFNERTDRQYTYSLAANLTAGVSYKVSDITSLDFNYRYLYVGGSDMSANINGYSSKIEVADQHEHYLRAGLRFDID